MARFLITADGVDQSGIVAGVTAALAAKDCNLEDTSMTRLGGRFVMLVLATGDADEASLFETLRANTAKLALNFSVDRLEDEPVAEPAVGERWAISVYGADRRGIVSTITAKLAEVGANIEDLSTRRTGDDSAPVYTMLIDVTMPPGVEGGEVAAELDALAQSMGIACHARSVDPDTF